MTKRKASTKKAAGKRLNKEGRLTPVDALQFQMEHWQKLMQEEIAKPPADSNASLIATYAARAQKCAESLAPYRHARMSPTDELTVNLTTKVIRTVKQCATTEEWLRNYGDKNDVERAISEAASSDKADEMIQRARGGVAIEMPDLPREKLN